MKLNSSRSLFSAAVFLATASLVQAHPGHDGHDFTWDFSHLAAYPDATILCIGVLGALGWAVWKVMAAAPAMPKTAPVPADDERSSR
jgi:hydrogenase/urease accessory protein HupE